MSCNDPNPHAFVGLGSNLGDRAGYLLLALRGMLEAGLSVMRLSSIYETAPVALINQPPFLNMVAEVRSSTVSSPEEVMERLQCVENGLGRTRSVPMGPRTIDLDLLLYQDEQRNTEFLTLPHPRLHLRRFVLVPLAELAPQLVHPTLNKTIGELLAELEDDSEVKPWHP